MNDSFSIACTEVTLFLEQISSDKRNKIPDNVVLYYKENMDTNYKFEIDKNKSILEQNFSKKAATIIIAIYKKYLANEEEIFKLKEHLRMNTNIIEEKKSRLYKIAGLEKNLSKVEASNLELGESNKIIVRKDNFIKRVWGIIKKFFDRK